jgi:serine/threonine-protein kinase
MGASIARALHAAHGAGLVHRDVKPGNVMVTPSGEVKVMDFGIARAAADDTLTQTGTVIGTAAYLAPEQARGDKADARTDVYALGCVLYEMMTGRPPFTGDSAVQLAYRHVNEEPPPPSELVAVPADLEGTIMRALAKDPDRRFPSAKAMLNALSGTQAGRDTEPGQPPTDVLPTAPVAPTRPRRRWPAAVAAAAVLALGGGLLALTSQEDPPAQRRDRAAGARAQDRQASPAAQPSPAVPLTVQGAFDDLNRTVAQGASAGAISEEVAAKLIDRSAKAEEMYFAGEAQPALEELSKAQGELAQALEQGQITQQRAGRVARAIAVTVETIVTSPPPSPVEPPEEGGDEDGGPGNSEFAPGHNKGKGNSGED